MARKVNDQINSRQKRKYTRRQGANADKLNTALEQAQAAIASAIGVSASKIALTFRYTE